MVVKVSGLLLIVIGMLLGYSDNLFKQYLNLNERQIHGPLVVDMATQGNIDKFKIFKQIYNKYHLLLLGIILSIIGTLLLAFS